MQGQECHVVRYVCATPENIGAGKVGAESGTTEMSLVQPTVVAATPVDDVGSDIHDKIDSLAEAMPNGVSVDDVKVAAVSSEVGLNDIEGKVEVAKGGSWSLDAFTANDASNYCGDHNECNSGYGEIAFLVIARKAASGKRLWLYLDPFCLRRRVHPIEIPLLLRLSTLSGP